ncbi:MAG: glycerol acyltransferase [Crocinitomicaceae bacterium]|nr:glycerol acyltransferase [Crocinitomicaceae bacterium]|tara:strand:- start:825 stop:1688 length:864 start_codon:yes stop_codon:yes gene_type:complete
MDFQKNVDIGKVIEKKSPRFFKLMPRFLLRKFKSLLHESDLNNILKNLSGKEKLDFISGGLKELQVISSNYRLKEIPRKKGVIIVANHPLGGLDGLALINEIGKYRKDIKFLVNDILSEIEPFKPYFIPINKHGFNSRENIVRLEELFESEECIVIFPAGLVSRKKSGIIKDLEWRKTFVTKAKKHNKPIYPVYISGQNSNRFYKIARWRSLIGIKINLEMFFLVDEMFKQKGNNIKITMGKLIDPKILDNKKNDSEWAQAIKNYVYKIQNNINVEFIESIKNEKNY